jgi:hypothetical protein
LNNAKAKIHNYVIEVKMEKNIIQYCEISFIFGKYHQILFNDKKYQKILLNSVNRIKMLLNICYIWIIGKKNNF